MVYPFSEFGLVAPETVLTPYNETLNEISVDERREWSQRVVAQIQDRWAAGSTLTFLAGEKYREFLTPALRRLGFGIEFPMQGLAIGEQLHWLAAHIR